MKTINNISGKGTTVTISPSVVSATTPYTFEIQIKLGKDGLAANDSLGVVCGSNTDRWQFQFASHVWGTYYPWQVNDPAAPNFLTANCSRADVELSLDTGRSGGLKQFHNKPDHLVRALRERCRYVLEIQPSHDLKEGDTITLVWGDRRWGAPGVTAPAVGVTYYFLPFKFSLLPVYDRELPLRQGDFSVLPAIRVTGKAATRLHAAFQPLMGRGENFTIHCVAVDEFGNLDENFNGTVTARLSPRKNAGEAETIQGTLEAGRAQLSATSPNAADWYQLDFESKDICSARYPLLVSETAPRTRIFFGAMHGHTIDCDGTFPADEHFWYARRVAGLDFCGLGSHAEYFGTKSAFSRYLDTATAANEPNAFVTFYGYEWAGQGHVNAYFLKQEDVVNIYGKRILKGEHPKDEPEFRQTCNKENRFLKLLQAHKAPVLCIAHCHSRYVDPVDDDILRLHEVYSMHQGNPLDARLRDVLARGIRVGVVAGSDSHRLPAGSLCPDPDSLWKQPHVIDGEKASQSIQKKCGIQATFARGLTRELIWEGMCQRHTYGTTGARMIILLSVNDADMGEMLHVKRNAQPVVRARVGGTANLQHVVLFRYTEEEWTTPFVETKINDSIYEFEFADQNVNGSAIYYLRVEQVDGEMGWSSPVWVETEA